jgi:uncharacterized protein YjbJ (UPF0337 family)
MCGAGNLPAKIRRALVSAKNKIKNAAKETKGKAKRGTGKAAGDPYLEAEGAAEKKKGNLKQAGEKLKDTVKK